MRLHDREVARATQPACFAPLVLCGQLPRHAASGTTTYSYDAASNLLSYTYPNGVETTATYDQQNRLTAIGSAKAGTALWNYAYTLGAVGDRTTVADQGGR